MDAIVKAHDGEMRMIDSSTARVQALAICKTSPPFTSVLFSYN